MSIFTKNTIGGKQHVYFDGARLIDALVSVVTTKDPLITMQYLGTPEDMANIEQIKLEMGASEQEQKLRQLFTVYRDASDDVDEVTGKPKIKNLKQKEIYEDYCKMNNTLACLFMYFYHTFYWQKFADDIPQPQNGPSITHYAGLTKRGNVGTTPPNKILEQIKSVYPYLNNLLISFIEKKHNTSLSDAIMSVEQAVQNVQEVEFLGTIKNQKSAPISKLSLVKKR